MKVSYLAGMSVSASGLAAQRAVMNTTAENLANAQTTRTESGEPYRRQVVALAQDAVTFSKALGGSEIETELGLLRTDPAHLLPNQAAGRTGTGSAAGVKATVAEDQGEFPQIYDPGHPDADANGMVRMPNVETAREMVNLLVASRAYEANVAALQASRKLAEASLNLAR